MWSKVYCLKETTRWNADQALNRGEGGRRGILNILKIKHDFLRVFLEN